LIALDAGEDLKYQPFRISLPREVRAGPKIMLGLQVHRFHFALAGSFTLALRVSAKQVAGAIVLIAMLDAGLFTRVAPAAAPPQVARVSFDEPGPSSRGQAATSGSPSSWPAEITSELDRIDAMHRGIITGQAIEDWRFDTVRAGYQGLLKRGGDRAELEEAIRVRLARVTQHEQAARAARAIESILARSHRRDHEVAAVRQRLAQQAQSRARAYDAVGFVQPSARKVDGHKVFTLIGREGTAIAYLDIPPGLNPEPLIARRVGVRGQAHWSEDLGTRLISVRDMESIEPKR
jgi:hypothetical protein